MNSEKIWKIQEKIVKRYEKYGKKTSWRVKWYGKYGRKVCWKVKRYGKYGRKFWNDMEIMENTDENSEKIW